MARRVVVRFPWFLCVAVASMVVGCTPTAAENTRAAENRAAVEDPADRSPKLIQGLIQGQGPVLQTRATRIDRVTVELDGQELIVEFTGGPTGDVLHEPCATQYELDFDDETSPTRITVWQLEPTVAPAIDSSTPYACTAEGYGRELRHPFEGDGPREIVDGARNEPIGVLFITERLVPLVLPDGWAVQDTGAPQEPTATTTTISDGAAVVFLRTTLVADPEAALDRFHYYGPVETLTIRDGTPALTDTLDDGRHLRFVHGTYLYEVSGSAEVAPSILLAIGEGLT